MIQNKTQLMNKVTKYIALLKGMNLPDESLEWYLINNLEKCLEELEIANSAKDVENASKILSRFCLESMNWEDREFKL